MGKMIIKLPAIRKSMRKRGVSSAEEQGNKKTSSERVRKYRQKLKTDPKLRQKNEESKLKKKAENKAYKSKIKELREQNESFNNAFKQKQKLWKKNSRERKAEKNKEQTKETSTVTEKSSNMKGSNKPSTIRKRAQRVKKILPDSSVGWASTMKHLINNATPKRKSLLDVLSERSPSSSEDTRTLEINKIGRPKKSNEKVKKQLAFSEKPDTLWKKQKTLNQYKSRKLIQVKRLSKAKAFRENWNSKLETFLYANSRVMPNKKDAIKIAGNYVPKYHLLCSKKQLFAKFKKEHPTFGRQLSTFLKMIPKNFRSLDLRCRRVCVCTKDYNIDQKIEVLNKAASQKSLDLKATSRQLSTMTLCPYEGTPNRKCVDRVCENCGTQAIYQLYQPLLESFSDDQIFKYHQWETRTETVGKGKKRISRWVQVEKKSSIKELVDEVASCLEVFTGHLFRADFQHKVYTTLTSNLLIDQAVVVMDFSENIALEQQDQIESAHWTVQQVTLHPIFLVRHAAESTEENPIIMKESLIILSNDLTHNSGTVYVFTEQLLLHIKNNPGPCPIKVLHRFSDNCAAQYKSKLAFDHLIKLEEKHGIQIIYHYTESGHGKGPSDGLGAAIKKKLERMILGGKVINNAYQTYLALVQNQNENLNQKIIYIPDKKLQNSIPSKSKLSKTIKGTQSFHMVYQLRPRSGVLVCDDLSCSCDICIGKQTGPCFFSQFRHDHQYFNLMTGRKLSSQMLNVNEVTLSSTCSLLAKHGDGSSLGDGLGMSTCNSELTDALRCSIQSHEGHLNDVNSSMVNFQLNVASKGWQLDGTTPDDGNCFFWAVSNQLDKLGIDSLTHVQLRSKVVQYIHELSEVERCQISGFLTTTLETYLEGMRRDGTYADHVVIQAMSKMLSCGMQIVHADTPDIIVCPESSKMLVLGYLPEIQHYVCLKPFIRFANDDFVAVRLSSGRKKVLYLAKVLQVDEDVQLRYLKSTQTAGIYAWPSTEDISWQSQSDIIQKLSTPELLAGRGLQLKFNLEELNLCKKNL